MLTRIQTYVCVTIDNYIIIYICTNLKYTAATTRWYSRLFPGMHNACLAGNLGQIQLNLITGRADSKRIQFLQHVKMSPKQTKSETWTARWLA